MLQSRIEQSYCYLFVDVFAVDLQDIHTEWKIVNSKRWISKGPW